MVIRKKVIIYCSFIVDIRFHFWFFVCVGGLNFTDYSACTVFGIRGVLFVTGFASVSTLHDQGNAETLVSAVLPTVAQPVTEN